MRPLTDEDIRNVAVFATRGADCTNRSTGVVISMPHAVVFVQRHVLRLSRAENGKGGGIARYQ
jgi:hypothetical protein